MKHQKFIPGFAAIVIAALAVSACGGGGGDSGGSPPSMAPAPPPPVAPAPPPPTPTNFTVFTRDQMASASTSETAEPVDIELLEWVFTDDDNETAYDDIIESSM
jgi:hypothetical protein